MKFTRSFLFVTLLASALYGCGKDKDNNSSGNEPRLTLKTGAGYTSSSITIGKAASFKVGIIAEKTNTDLTAYIVDYSVDGGPLFNSVNGPVGAAGKERFETDINLITRNQAGTEKWIFRIADANGNLGTKEIILTVQ